MDKKEIIKLLQNNKPPCLETLRGNLLEFDEAERIMTMEYAKQFKKVIEKKL